MLDEVGAALRVSRERARPPSCARAARSAGRLERDAPARLARGPELRALAPAA
jgi:hypothetical protein